MDNTIRPFANIDPVSREKAQKVMDKVAEAEKTLLQADNFDGFVRTESSASPMLVAKVQVDRDSRKGAVDTGDLQVRVLDKDSIKIVKGKIYTDPETGGVNFSKIQYHNDTQGILYDAQHVNSDNVEIFRVQQGSKESPERVIIDKEKGTLTYDQSVGIPSDPYSL
jgi:hypothetical protein